MSVEDLLLIGSSFDLYILLYPPSGNWSISFRWSDAFLGGFVDTADAGDIGQDGDGIEEEIEDGDEAVAGDTGDIAGGNGVAPDFISTAVQLTLQITICDRILQSGRTTTKVVD